MALITKMHRCAFCGSSEVTVSENGTYTCRDCGKTADHRCGGCQPDSDDRRRC